MLQWYQDLVKQVNADAYAQRRVIWDVLNEPDSKVTHEQPASPGLLLSQHDMSACWPLAHAMGRQPITLYLRCSLSTTPLTAMDVFAAAHTSAQWGAHPLLQGLRWEASGGRPGMATTYLTFMDTVYKKYPSASHAHSARC